MKRRYGPLCQEVHARNGDRDVEQLEAKVDILELMEQMFEYRTKLGFIMSSLSLIWIFHKTSDSDNSCDFWILNPKGCFSWFQRIFRKFYHWKFEQKICPDRRKSMS